MEMSKNPINTGTKTKVQQQFKEDCKVKNIMQKFVNTGVPPLGNAKPPMFIDFTKFGDYTEMLNHVTKVKQQFMALPAKTRKAFDNEPQKLLNFVDSMESDKDVLKAVELGLMTSEQAQDYLETPPTPGASEPPEKAAVGKTADKPSDGDSDEKTA